MKSILLAAISLLFFIDHAQADWYGGGAKSAGWITSHGGVIIRYKIIANGAADRYRAVLYKNGKPIEWEVSKTGRFDDPLEGTYVVKAFRGGVDDHEKKHGEVASKF